MSERSSVSEITIGKQIGATTGVFTRGLYVYGEAWSASTEDKIYFTFKTICLRDRQGKEKLLYVEGAGDIGSGASQSWYVTANAGTGIGKLDTGSFASDTWYYLYILYNSDTGDISGIYSTSYDYPVFPSGYTYYRRIASLRSSGTAFLNFKQIDDRVILYTPRLILDDGSAGTEEVWNSLSISSFIPITARIGIFLMGNNSRNGGMARESDGHGGWYMQIRDYGLGGDDFNNTDLCPTSKYTWSTLLIPIFGVTTVYYWYVNNACHITTSGWEENLSIYY